jgi:hypothetical protein
MIWALLDSSVTSMAATGTARATLDGNADCDDAASLCLTIHITHPLVENQEDGVPVSTTSPTDVFSSGNGTLGLFPDSLFSQSAFDADQWLFNMS